MTEGYEIDAETVFCYCGRILKNGVAQIHPRGVAGCVYHQQTDAPDEMWKKVDALAAEIAQRQSPRWAPEDLDRCEHGRHSVDDCFDCPGGQSTGNLYLLGLARGHLAELRRGDSIRIGTTLGGLPIEVVPVRNRRSRDER